MGMAPGITGNDHPSLGKAALWSCITGVVLPGSLLALVLVSERVLPLEFQAIAICGILFVILELVAFGCGIMARRTTPGKVGLVISGLLLLYPAYDLVLLVLELLGVA
jgi:hypothetical protein